MHRTVKRSQEMYLLEVNNTTCGRSWLGSSLETNWPLFPVRERVKLFVSTYFGESPIKIIQRSISATCRAALRVTSHYVQR